MLRANTTFVLGAGASCCFGFPTGSELSREICGLTRAYPKEKKVRAFSAATTLLGIYSEPFFASFQESGTHSIDAFLARRDIFSDAGKAAIAAYLLDCEKPEKLFSVDGKANNSDWYGYLWSRMYDQVNDVADLVVNNNVSFITFNYDRSLELFLHTAIKNTYGLTADLAYEISSQFPIHHVHGHLGKFGPETSFRYGLVEEEPRALGNRMASAVKSLRVIPADRADEIDSNAFDLLWQAENIIFLGYGFDNQNNDRLGIRKLISRKSDEGLNQPHIFATTLGMKNKEREYAFNSIADSRADLIHYSSQTCYESLREWGVLL
ncbi:SIR2 family protein [Herminiimonas contaminans]|uniref:SIR2-like protein n=1 Tax=Herminiimonas contaminans TaxID=1111140 RepID=A0ABS0ETB4_9BURK|nr:hypothetical protein [Herminiimonas contaminans]MBF8178092.1 hypothetical protein [Herminiimonas contaminans]